LESFGLKSQISVYVGSSQQHQLVSEKQSRKFHKRRAKQLIRAIKKSSLAKQEKPQLAEADNLGEFLDREILQ